ncbi:hypothetical protein N9I63_01410 [Hyphomicrobiales bacterium]|nr:hypothetical protein [Hyphomicrobiales bacterium]
MMNNLRQRDFFWLAPIIILLFGLLPMPYGYYTLSRFIVCFCAAIFAYKLNAEKNILVSWLFILIAIIYNPIIPIHLYDKGLWVAINIPTIILFFLKKNKV